MFSKAKEVRTVFTRPNVRESVSRNALGTLSAVANDALEERMKS